MAHGTSYLTLLLQFTALFIHCKHFTVQYNTLLLESPLDSLSVIYNKHLRLYKSTPRSLSSSPSSPLSTLLGSPRRLLSLAFYFTVLWFWNNDPPSRYASQLISLGIQSFPIVYNQEQTRSAETNSQIETTAYTKTFWTPTQSVNNQLPAQVETRLLKCTYMVILAFDSTIT
ncbi:hypothetical protein NW761_003268 [Fusarium oxysporum]|nr:hypothetical protein NW763_008621 [Fusarium oxysporum]KAJ4057118.1 hypothetical protein NW758_001549 [Fusarium oxysporum]KAJ4069574.1 hypothetical protein NW753_000458 [Fusarium oxysporum]KAJ4100294.1 hypothetical protein NW761_003268 [Fusarium oxysporum]KAJ4101482.1 hypothetical protein NW756_001904 [Fusarium oxysporum]